MKAILIVDMPKSCADCKLSDFGRCWGTYSYVHMRSDDIPVNCPLKPMPSKRKNPITKTFGTPFNKGQVKGWNECLEEIEK